MSSNLLIDISRTTSKKVLRITDASIYTDEVENYILEILPTGSAKWITFKVNPNFDLKNNASSLQIAKVKTVNDLPDLPDGIYQIRQSVKPNFSTLVEFFHLRTSSLEYDWNIELCKLYSKQCTISKKEFQDNRAFLMSVWMDIKAAIAKVEICHEKKEGLQLYEKAKNDLKKYKDACGC